MYKLLIVDDEPDIVDGLYAMLQNREKRELDLYKAYSPQEAMEWIDRTRMDIVLSDIRMPGMSGLQLLEQLRERWQQCKLIFVTGFDDFDYVYKAIQYEDVQYLLKTEGHEAIADAVDKAIAKLDMEQRADELLRWAEQEMSVVRPLMQREYLMDILSGEPLALASRERRFAELHITLDADRPLYLVIGRAARLPEHQSALEKTQLFYSVKFMADQQLSPAMATSQFVYDRSLLIWLIQPRKPQTEAIGQKPISPERIPRYIRGVFENVQILCMDAMRLPISFVVDAQAANWEQIPSKYDSLKMWLYSRMGNGTEMYSVNYMEDGRPAAKVSPGRQTPAQRMELRYLQIPKLEHALDSGNRDAFHELLLRITDKIEEEEDTHYNSVIAVFYSISLMFISYLYRWGLYDQVAPRIELNRLTSIDKHFSLGETMAYFRELADLVFRLRSSAAEEETVSAIGKIKRHVHEHLGGDLSLIKLAELVHFNPSYLSRLFKQETGVNLLTYINDAKLDHAKELLADPRFKIHEVALAVGFESPAYFTQFFKKAARVSPHEYRETILKK